MTPMQHSQTGDLAAPLAHPQALGVRPGEFGFRAFRTRLRVTAWGSARL